MISKLQFNNIHEDNDVNLILENAKREGKIKIYLNNSLPYCLNYYFKGIGIFLTDGYYYKYKIVKNKEKVTKIEILGLKSSSAKAFLKTFLNISRVIEIKIRKSTLNRNHLIYFDLKIYPKNRKFFKILENILKNTCKYLESLNIHHLIWLFAGVLEGDGYVSRNYLAVSYNQNSEKGKIIHCLLKILHSKGIIQVSKYYGSPKYEHIFFIKNLDYLDYLSKIVNIDYKAKILRTHYISGLIKRTCKLTKKDIVIIDRYLKSAYIDYRRSEKRSPIIVVYLEKNTLTLSIPSSIARNDNRVMIKIPSSCIDTIKQHTRSNKLKNIIFNYLNQKYYHNSTKT